jgi:transcription initiation factor TFIID subunit 10
MDRRQQDVPMSGTEGENGNTGAPGPGAGSTTLAGGVNDLNPVASAAAPSKKDASLREFLGQMDDYAPIVRALPRFFPWILSHFALRRIQ